MIRRLLVAVMLMPGAVMSWAQDFYRHEISYGFGFGDVGELKWEQYNEKVVPANYEQSFFCGVHIDNTVYWEYNYNINERLAVGASFGCGYFSENYDRCDIAFSDETSFPKVSEQMTTEGNCAYAMATIRYKWYRSARNKFRLYSQAALGYAETEFSSDFWQDRYYDVGEDRYASIHDYLGGSSESHHLLAYQFTPIAIETGKSHWHWYCELGYGYKGVLNMGIRYSFHKAKNKK